MGSCVPTCGPLMAPAGSLEDTRRKERRTRDRVTFSDSPERIKGVEIILMALLLFKITSQSPSSLNSRLPLLLYRYYRSAVATSTVCIWASACRGNPWRAAVKKRKRDHIELREIRCIVTNKESSLRRSKTYACHLCVSCAEWKSELIQFIICAAIFTRR